MEGGWKQEQYKQIAFCVSFRDSYIPYASKQKHLDISLYISFDLSLKISRALNLFMMELIALLSHSFEVPVPSWA